MTLRIASVTFDCDDPLATAGFWSKVLDRPIGADANQFAAMLPAPDHAGTGVPTMMFLKVPEPKTAKDRCHVDLHTESRDSVEAEVGRITSLGATLIRPPTEEFGVYWATLQDPEGHEFCIGADRRRTPSDNGHPPSARRSEMA
jgi:predicted enzyme related to lactoylglutathione lyase